MKIAGAAAHIGAVEGPPILDVKPDRRAVFRIHAGVHGEDERLSLALQIAQDARESAVGLAFLVAQKQANVALARVEVAHRIGDAVVLDLGAGSGIGGGLSCEEKRQSSARPPKLSNRLGTCEPFILRRAANLLSSYRRNRDAQTPVWRYVIPGGPKA